jgi:xanthine dehydrogenase molybdenum-binding subunit
MAALKVSQAVREQLLEYAKEKIGRPDDPLRIRNSVIFRGRERLFSLPEITRDADDHNRQFAAVKILSSPNALSWHAHFAQVEVDTWTGLVKVNKLITAHDLGKAINPAIVEGQIEGGAVMGLGYALSEEICYDKAGQQLNNSLQSYILPTAADVGPIESIIIEATEPSGPYGARGIGENSVAPVAPAVASGVFSAIGLRFNILPLTPERVFSGWRSRERFSSGRCCSPES